MNSKACHSSSLKMCEYIYIYIVFYTDINVSLTDSSYCLDKFPNVPHGTRFSPISQSWPKACLEDSCYVFFLGKGQSSACVVGPRMSPGRWTIWLDSRKGHPTCERNMHGLEGTWPAKRITLTPATTHSSYSSFLPPSATISGPHSVAVLHGNPVPALTLGPDRWPLCLPIVFLFSSPPHFTGTNNSRRQQQVVELCRTWAKTTILIVCWDKQCENPMGLSHQVLSTNFWKLDSWHCYHCCHLSPLLMVVCWAGPHLSFPDRWPMLVL
jgi:hypothetical protein